MWDLYTPVAEFMAARSYSILAGILHYQWTTFLLKGSTYYCSIWKNGFHLTSFPSAKARDEITVSKTLLSEVKNSPRGG